MSGGTKHDSGKTPMALIPVEALEAEAQVWGFGESKYGAHNWRKGLSILRICSAAMRHLTAIIRGEDYDKESGLPHAAHLRCCAGMLITFIDRKELDDRWKNEDMS